MKAIIIFLLATNIYAGDIINDLKKRANKEQDEAVNSHYDAILDHVVYAMKNDEHKTEVCGQLWYLTNSHIRYPGVIEKLRKNGFTITESNSAWCDKTIPIGECINGKQHCYYLEWR